MNNKTDKQAALAKIGEINAIDGFDPTPFAVDYTDMNTGETSKRLPVMTQLAWFRLKYPQGRIAVTVVPNKDYFVATAKVYCNYNDPVECFLSEASASRGYLQDKPTVSPREWAQTAAVGIALRNAGFGLQFTAAGDSFDLPSVKEQTTEQENHNIQPKAEEIPSAACIENNMAQTETQNYCVEPQTDPLEEAMKMPCPITRYQNKTLGEMISIDPNALIWLATKYTGNESVSAGAKLICDHALASA